MIAANRIRENAPVRSLRDPGTLWMVIGLCAVSIPIMVGSIVHLQTARLNLQNQLAVLEECRHLSSEIAQWTNRPRIASLELESPQELTGQITTSIAEAGIPLTALISVSPSEAVRVGNTDYRRRAYYLELVRISLPKLAAFYNGLAGEPGLYWSELWLKPSTPPIASETEENWDVGLTLTQLIYSPTSL